jgi:hypothetical protein
MNLYEWVTFDEVCETIRIKVVANSLEEAQLMLFEREEKGCFKLPDDFLEDCPNVTDVSKPRIIHLDDGTMVGYYE